MVVSGYSQTWAAVINESNVRTLLSTKKLHTEEQATFSLHSPWQPWLYFRLSGVPDAGQFT